MPNDEVQQWCKRHCHPGVYCPDGYCTEAREAVTARVKRALPPAPEPTKYKGSGWLTAVQLAQLKFDKCTEAKKKENTRRRR